MTRINCIPVEELTDLHLLAEYREMPRVSTLIWKWYHKTYSTGLQCFVRPVIPQSYIMGKGHVTFFYDKGEYLSRRFKEIVDELTKRGYNLNYTVYRPHPYGMNNDWEPDKTAQEINRARIRERLHERTNDPDRPG